MEIKSTDVRGYGKLLMIGTAMLLAGCNSVFVLSGNPLQPSSKLAITQATLEQEKLEMRVAVRLRQPAALLPTPTAQATCRVAWRSAVQLV
jgi:hypothetical protein